MEIELIEVKEAQKSILRQLIELYEYDFTEYDQKDLNEHGFFGYPYFDHYWTEEARFPFFIKVDGNFAGFVLVNDYCYVLKDQGARSIAEFFVMRKYRRKGVGRRIARWIFDKYPGKWEVIQHSANLPAIHFWENVIGAYSNGNFKVEPVQTEHWQGRALIFENPK